MFFKIISANKHPSLIYRINSFCTSSKHRFESHYDVLQLKRNCTTKEVKDAFIKLSKQYHPDTTNSNESQKKFVRILEAYNILSKPNLRRSYDLGLMRPESMVKTDSTKQYYEYDPHFERVVKDPSFWEHRDKSQDKFYQDRSYYGIKGIPRLSNKMIVIACMVFATFGIGLQVILIRKSLTFRREHILQKSREAEEAYMSVKRDAIKYGNEVQLQRLKERFERNNLMPKEQ